MQLNYKQYGNKGTPLIILHGFLGSLDNWHTLSNQFGNQFTVFNIDQRNHGKSPHTNSHTIAEMVNDLFLFIKQHQLGSSHIIGHSMGGKVAMQFALTYPDLVNQLIVADIAPKQYKPGHDDVFKAIFAVDVNAIKTRKEAEEAMLPFLPDFGTRQFLLKNLERTESGLFTWKMNLDVLHRDYNEIISEIQADGAFNKPSLFLKGGNSLYIKDHDVPHINSLFTNSILNTIPNAGHWLHAEQPELFYNSVTNFLQ